MTNNAVVANIIAPHFYPVHNAIKKNKFTHIWLKGGRGSAKSSFAGVEIPYGIMLDPNANAVVIRKVDKDLRETVYEQIKWGIEKLGVSHLWKFYTSPMKAVYLPTRQRILFKGAEEPHRFKSIKFSKGYCKFVWYEELTEFKPNDIQVINPSLLRGGDVFTVIYTYNPPESVQSWVNQDVLRHNPNRLIHHSTYKDVPPAWVGEQFRIDAEHMEVVQPERYRHIYMGEVTGTGGEVFRNIKSEIITDEQIKSFSNIRRGLDFGYATDPLHYSEMEYDKTRRVLYIFREIHGAGMKNSDAVEKIKAYIGDNPSATITADSAEPRTINEFRELGLYGIIKAKKGVDSVKHGIKFLQGLEAIIIDPVQCPNTLREFNGYELEKDSNGNFRSDYPDKNNHSIDSVRYATENDAINKEIRFY